MKLVSNLQLGSLFVASSLIAGIAFTPAGQERNREPQKAGKLPAATPVQQLTPEQAIAVAVNELAVVENGFRLSNPRHRATLTAAGIEFTPQRGGPRWRWQLQHIGVSDRGSTLPGIDVTSVMPVRDSNGAVVYPRGGVRERYLPRTDCIEQQFIIPEALRLEGNDLCIAGAVNCRGEFQQQKQHWRWQTDRGAVRLGDVHVYDANGQPLTATMKVNAGRTQIVIAGADLSTATYPVTVDPEIGVDDFRISDMGSDDLFDAFTPAVAFNSTKDEYLVVWSGDDNTGSLVDEELEIYGQLINAMTGAELLPDDFRISHMGPDGDDHFSAVDPAVTYNLEHKEYLVVWSGDDASAPLVDDEFEIFGQFLDMTGAPLGNSFRISEMGQDGDTDFDAHDPQVCFNSKSTGYLVAWSGDDTTDGEFEIFVQLINANTKLPVGVDVRISDMGFDGLTANRAESAAVTFNPDQSEYLVVWSGNDDSDLPVGDFEIYGQRLSAANGKEYGDNDFRISDMGPESDVNFGATHPAVAYNQQTQEYLVVWSGDDDSPGDDEFEVFGQRLSGAEAKAVGINDFLISEMGPKGTTDYAARHPRVIWNRKQNEYLVVWEGDDDLLTDEEFEIYCQRLDAAGTNVGNLDYRISDMGPDFDPAFDAARADVAYNPALNQYYVVWQGDDNTGDLTDDEFEIFAQLLTGTNAADIAPNDLRISDMGSDKFCDAIDPAVAYNSIDNEYLVVWSGNDNDSGLTGSEHEIFGQRINAANGTESGLNDFLISHMGPVGNVEFFAFDPAVAHNSADNQYLVVWAGDSDSLGDDDYEIFGQRLDNQGSALQTQFRISEMGPDGKTAFKANAPDVAYNKSNNQYLVVWQGDDDSVGDDEIEIFGQLINGSDAAVVRDDFRLTQVGTEGDTTYEAVQPAVVHNMTENQFLVAWTANEQKEYEIYIQLLDAGGNSLTSNAIRVSDMGPDGDQKLGAVTPAVAWNAIDNQYLVVWWGDDATAPLIDDEYEVFGQVITAAGTEFGVNDFRISDLGGSGNTQYGRSFGASRPDVAYNSAINEYLVVWQGDDNVAGHANDEYDVFVRRVSSQGNVLGGTDQRISEMGGVGDPTFGTYYVSQPKVAYNSTNDEFLVVWSADDDAGSLVDEEFEIYEQRFKSPLKPKTTDKRNPPRTPGGTRVIKGR